MWKDNELNDYHRKKLNSYGIIWFESSNCWDVIESNCMQLQAPNHWSSNERDGLYHWDEIKWGGLSEWGRENIEMSQRYLGRIHEGNDDIDPHPSQYTSRRFIEDVLLDLINKKVQ